MMMIIIVIKIKGKIGRVPKEKNGKTK